MIFSLQHWRAVALAVLVSCCAYNLIARAYGLPNGLAVEVAGVDVLFIASACVTAAILIGTAANAIAWLLRGRSSQAPALSFDKERRQRNATAPRMASK